MRLIAVGFVWLVVGVSFGNCNHIPYNNYYNYYGRYRGPPPPRYRPRLPTTTTSTSTTTTTPAGEIEPPEYEGPITTSTTTTTTTTPKPKPHSYYHNYYQNYYHGQYPYGPPGYGHNQQYNQYSMYGHGKPMYGHAKQNSWYGRGAPRGNNFGRAQWQQNAFARPRGKSHSGKWIEIGNTNLRQRGQNSQRRPFPPRERDRRNFPARPPARNSVPTRAAAPTRPPIRNTMQRPTQLPQQQWRDNPRWQPPQQINNQPVGPRPSQAPPQKPWGQNQWRNNRRQNQRRDQPVRGNQVNRPQPPQRIQFQDRRRAQNQIDKPQNNFNSFTSNVPLPSGVEIMSRQKQKVRSSSKFDNVMPQSGSWGGLEAAKQSASGTFVQTTKNPWAQLWEFFGPSTTAAPPVGGTGGGGAGFDAWGYPKNSAAEALGLMAVMGSF